jgi:hypothetical protein
MDFTQRTTGETDLFPNGGQELGARIRIERLLRYLHAAAEGRGRGLDRSFQKVFAAPRRGAHIILPSTGTINSATMLMILIRGLMAGPAVSL